MWLATLLALAIIAFLIVKYIKGKGEHQQADHARLTESSVRHESLTQSTNDSSIDSATNDNSATDTGAASSPAEQLQNSASTNAGVTAATPGAASLALDSGDTLTDVREMIKILNLAEPDASRLAISPEQLRALRNADQSAMPSEQTLAELAARLRKMLA